jgi:hypothetical protein
MESYSGYSTATIRHLHSYIHEQNLNVNVMYSEAYYMSNKVRKTYSRPTGVLSFQVDYSPAKLRARPEELLFSFFCTNYLKFVLYKGGWM